MFLPGVIAGILIISGVGALDRMTSTDSYCASCHIHPHATTSWERSVHSETRTGTRTGCIDCHLPPRGEGYYRAKAITGSKHIWARLTRDSASFDWDSKALAENARRHTYESSCITCHQNLFPLSLSREGEEAHLYYTNSRVRDGLHCINCHLNAGHYRENFVPGENLLFGYALAEEGEVADAPALVEEFISFRETIPGTSVSFNMVAVPGGTFMMGSPEDEPFRNSDEGPVREVLIDSLFFGEVEVTWDEYLAFYSMTSQAGRADFSSDEYGDDVDAFTGASPPYGQPDQNWGLGSRPAITMTWQAAESYCRWLSEITGKNYRLPTEAEWEYAARAGTTTPWYVDADLADITGGWLRRVLFGSGSRELLSRYTIYSENSGARTGHPESVKPNSFGLRNMAGNVAEFCSDWYYADAYSLYPEGLVVNPTGPPSGNEKVIRGGSFRDDAPALRSAARDHTRTDEWQRTDPQIPKSVWWYSDCTHVGFRVVCDYDINTGRRAPRDSGGVDK